MKHRIARWANEDLRRLRMPVNIMFLESEESETIYTYVSCDHRKPDRDRKLISLSAYYVTSQSIEASKQLVRECRGAFPMGEGLKRYEYKLILLC